MGRAGTNLVKNISLTAGSPTVLNFKTGVSHSGSILKQRNERVIVTNFSQEYDLLLKLDDTIAITDEDDVWRIPAGCSFQVAALFYVVSFISDGDINIQVYIEYS